MSNLRYNPHLELPPPSPSPPLPPPQQQQHPSSPNYQQLQQGYQQQHIPSVYPKLPAQDEQPPSYSASSPSYANMPQPPYPQYIPNQQPQPYPYPQYQPPPNTPPVPQNQQLNGARPPVMFYGSMAPPNVSNPPQQQVPSQHTVQPVTSLRTTSDLVQCPHCQQLVQTVLDYDSGLCTGLSVAGLFLAGCHSGGCLIPFIFPWTKDVTHHCPSCKEKIATFTRLERDTRVTAPPAGL
ncbi:LITAF-like zinc ribbon domain-containing protein [Parasitella parasitica]|nr:LITAF-like zinc ribbon domain-containing protein [Parasitella parasitica]